MLKATLSSAVLLGLLAWSVPSFAEVQNVKVGGDVTVRAFARRNLDLNNNSTTTALDSTDRFLMSTTGVNIGADLTENVGAFIRLANERDWNIDGGATGDLDISQAYVTLKELFYSPLTVRVGTQPIRWGRGFVLGSNLLPGILLAGVDRNTAITANEFTDFTAFDAIRATLDLSGVGGMPLNVDYVYIKSDENITGASDDVNIQGVNLGSHSDAMNSEFETYYLVLTDKSRSATIGNNKKGNVNTIGLRGSAHPAEGASVYGELAYQFGKRATDLEGIVLAGDAQQAWAANLGADYTADMAMKPKIGGEWRFYSGSELNNVTVGGWRAIAPGYFTTALREFQTRSTVGGFYPNTQTGVTSGATNQHELALYGGFNPIEDLTVNQRLSWFILDVGALNPTSGAGSPTRHSFVGTEWDSVLTYNYTDDVQFGVIYGLFLPGSVFRTDSPGTTNSRDVASELITSVSVKF